MPRRRVLAVTLPAAGHVGPMQALVEELARREADVCAVAVEPLAGARHLPPPPLEEDVERLPHGMPATAALLARVHRRVVDATRELVAEERPDVVVTDAMAGWARTAALAEGVPFVALSTTVAVHPAAAPLSAALGGRLEGGWRGAVRDLRAVARDRRAIRARHGVDPGDALALFRSRAGAAGVVVTVSRALQPRPRVVEREGPPVAWCGPLRDLDAAAREPLAPALAGGPCVLVAFGTLFEERPAALRAAVHGLRDRPERLVVARGRTPPEALGDPGPRTVVLERVPQVPLLARARAFVSHGGLNSVVEALWHGVPLVVCPQAGDQPLNAARVERLGAGVWIRDREPDAATIRAAVALVVDDPRFAGRARALGATLRAAGGAPRAAGAVLAAASS